MLKNISRSALVTLALMTTATTALAGSGLRVGSAGAQELLLPVGARGYALGGGIVGNVSGVEAAYYNPAGVSKYTGTEIMFTHMPYLAGIDVNFFGVSRSMGEWGSLAVAAKVVNIGDIEETTGNASEGTGAVFNPTLSVIGVTFSRQMTNRVGFGLTANYISENIFEVSASGVAFDFGFTYETGWNGVGLGMVIKNLGTDLRFSGTGFDRRSPDLGPRNVRPSNALSDLPSYIVLGAAYTPPTQSLSKVTFTGNFQSNNYNEDAWVGGAEYGWNEKFFLRGAYNYSVQENYIYGLSAGAGLRTALGEGTFDIEAGWRETEFFADEVVFTGKLGF